jgi:cytochrome c oxidase assembly factor CtaG
MSGSLRRRGLVGLGVLLIGVAVFSPLARWGEQRSFAAHMVQHLLLGDLSPLALAIGLRRRPLLPPLVALVLWIATLAVWHVPAVYEAALHHATLHVLQHVALLTAGLLLWSAVLAPGTAAAAARLGALLAAMLTNLALASVFLWWPRVLYSTYAHSRGFAGLSPQTDQRTGGGLMLLEGMTVMLAAAAWLILQFVREEPELATHAAEGASPSP